MSQGPLIVQSDRTVLLEVDHPHAEQARLELAAFAELERAPEHVHTYRLTSLGLWNARAAGVDAEQVLDTLLNHSRYPVPHALLVDIAEQMSRYGRLRLEQDRVHGLVLRTEEVPVLEEVLHARRTQDLFGPRIDEHTVAVPGSERGRLKQELLKVGWPAEDLAGYVEGTAHPIALTARAAEGGAPAESAPGVVGKEAAWQLRPYQRQAAEAFWSAGSGVVVLPCGAGKTVVGAAAMALSSTTTLILVANVISARQWRQELLRRTSLTEAEIGEYAGRHKQVRPVTIATYQVLTTRREGHYPHLDLLEDHDWGLIIYDEVHLLPAPVFRRTADLQARRRLGLTATLVREDGRASEVFSLIGPQRFDAAWTTMQEQGYLAPAQCVEVRVDLPEHDRIAYAMAAEGLKYQYSAVSEAKLPVVQRIVDRHPDEQVLVIGQYLDQLEQIAELIQAPLLTGRPPARERQRLLEALRDGTLRRLVVSKVANVSLDLPEVSVAVQVSGAFGSRQEEAQRLGRLLRPKADGRAAHFYTVVARETLDQQYAQRRQRFLAERGYAYTILDAEDLD